MTPSIVLHNIVDTVNSVGGFTMYLLLWYVLPLMAIGLVLFTLGRGLLLLIMWLRRRRSESLSKPS